MTRPAKVRIVEVGPRDGLQNEGQTVPTAIKIDLVHRLVRAGVCTVEATAFVSPKWVPQMADASQVMTQITREPGVSYPVLVPNLQGFEAAVAAGAREIAVFASASEAFSQRNINCTIAESLERFRPVLDAAQKKGLRVRGYLSCVLGCPYEGGVKPSAVADVAQALFAMGCEEISLGDTIGVGTPDRTRRMIEAVAGVVPIERLAGHYHDTYGQALANVFASLELGVATFDSAVGGLGGCPFARGAGGNLATEDLVYLMHGLGFATGIDLARLVEAGELVFGFLGRPNGSRAARALLAQRKPDPAP